MIIPLTSLYNLEIRAPLAFLNVVVTPMQGHQRNTKQKQDQQATNGSANGFQHDTGDNTTRRASLCARSRFRALLFTLHRPPPHFFMPTHSTVQLAFQKKKKKRP
jgi:hypothetical protein